MKNLATRMVVVAAVAAVLGVNAAKAGEKVKAEIPFKFRASTTYLPAGQYEITRLSTASGFALMIVTNLQTNERAAVTMRNPVYSNSVEQPRLIFRCAGNDCALARIWEDAIGYDLIVPRSPAEKERMAASIKVVAAIPTK